MTVNNITSVHCVLITARQLVAVTMLLTAAASNAAPTPTVPQNSFQGAAGATIKPQILGFSTGDCIRKGQWLTVTGRNFGSQDNKGIALGGHGIHIDLVPKSWGSSDIKTIISKDPRIQAGKSYYIGIEVRNHSQWLSNINRRITICAELPAGSPETPALPGVSPRSVTLPGGGRSPAPGGSPGEDYYEDGEDDTGTSPDTIFAPGDGGSLLGRGLPPAPQQQEALTTTVEPDQFEPAEVVAVTAGMEEAAALAQQLISSNITVKRRHVLKNLGLVISVLRIPPEYGVVPTVDSLRNAYSELWADVNHRYQLQGSGSDRKRYAHHMIHWPGSVAGCGQGLRIGLVDTGIESSHPALRGQHIVTRSFLSAGIKQAATDHGTAIAALLLGNPGDMEYAGLIPAAELYAAGVFRLRDGSHIEATSELIVRALDWLAGQQVSVINLSLGGPRDLVVELALQQVIDRNIAVVAAAGHAGKEGSPVYPAAQEGVLAVTAVDADNKPYREATQGSYIDFAAPGVDIWTVTPRGTGKYQSGTSYAAPFLTAVIAQTGLTVSSMEDLKRNALDLGVPGKDPVFGWGLVMHSGGCSR